MDDRHEQQLPISDREQADLIRLELSLGHKWKRVDGRIELSAIAGGKCVGPICAKCGVQFCVTCEWPVTIKSCE